MEVNMPLGQLGGNPKKKCLQVLFCFRKCMKSSWTLKENYVTFNILNANITYYNFRTYAMPV
jgi:hypothetical protein